MAVPDITTFNQRDVVTEIYGDSSDRSLTELFTAATGTFDSLYVGSKNSLYNFRNYKHITVTINTSISNATVTNLSTFIAYWMTFTAPVSSSIVYGICWNSAPNPTRSYNDYIIGTRTNSDISVTYQTLTINTSTPLIANKIYYFRTYIVVDGVTYYCTDLVSAPT